MALSFTPIAKQPDQAGLKFTRFASDGGAAVRSIFPGARINSVHRDNNIGSPGDDHHFSHGAVDVAPIEGMTFDQFTGKLKAAGYPIIQALDEVKHPSKGATGPHWHVALGEHESGLSFKPAEAPQAGLTFTPASNSPKAPKTTPRPVNGAPAAKELGLGEALVKGAKNIPHALADDATTALNDVRHPIDTAKRLGGEAVDALKHPVDTAKGLIKGTDRWLHGAGASVFEAVGLPGETPDDKAAAQEFKKGVVSHPIANALAFAPVGRLAGKLGARGFDAAKLATLSPAERAAVRARRAEEMAHAKNYGAIQRAAVGQHSLDRDRAIATLQKHQKVVGNASVEEQRALAHGVETASKGGIKALPEKFHDAALDLRHVAQLYRSKIEAVMKRASDSGPSFINDYYAHLWKQDAKADRFFSGKQGSGRNLKGRKFMTLQEGLAAGLKPIHENPIDQMSAYVDSMSKYLQAHDIQSRMRSAGMAKWAPEHAIPEGHIKLDGINTTREPVFKPGSEEADTLDRTVGRRVLVAPRKAAVMYNRFVDPGVENKLRRAGKTEQAGAFRFMKRATNATSNLTLAFSGFHPTLVAGKAVASDLGNAITHTFRGEPVKALKSIAHAPIAPFQPLVDKLRGKVTLKGRVLAGDQAMTHIDKLWRDAGGRLKNDSGYRASIRPNLLTSFRRGTLKRDVMDAAKNIGGKDRRWTERVSATADAAGRVMDTLSSAVFDHFVPAMKRQAFEREMASNLRAGMTEEQQTALARRVMDNVSGRMGELERDNIFWSQTRSDLMRLVILSPSWQYGDFKVLNDAVGGGRTAHGVAQAVGLVASYYMMNGIANYLHTGQRPQGQDWVAYRTGGTSQDRSGEHPERATFPSIMKDVFGLEDDPIGEAKNKMAPLPRALVETATNSDWRGLPVYRPASLGADEVPPDAPSNLKSSRGIAALAHVGGSFSPIGMQENPNGENSGISRFNQMVFGERPAGQKFYDPEGYEQFQKYAAKKSVQAETSAERRAAAKKRKRK